MMKRNYLIEKCYDNKYNIDLLGIHINSSQYSKYEKPTSIFDEKFNRNKINFYDGISTDFELVYHYDLLYLLGDKSCYPCGKIIEGAYDINWAPIFIIPTGLPIKVFRHINKSCCVYWEEPINNCLKSLPRENLKNYVRDYMDSFRSNEWYANNQLRRVIVSFTNHPIEEIYSELRSRKLLNPFELALGSIIFDFSITVDEVINYINYGKGIPYQDHHYLEYFRTRFSISNSTNLLISSADLELVVKSMTVNEIERFFEIDYLFETLSFDKSYPALMLDILDVSVFARYFEARETNGFDEGDIVKEKLQQKLSTVNITESSVKEHYRRIKSNIRNLENQVRKNSGYSEVGAVYTEKMIFNYFKENFKDQDIVYQYKPTWLGRQIFDVYFKSLNVAIEYNGKQHYQPVEFFGGNKGFENLVRLDTLKRKKCLENDCILFEIKYDENLLHSLLNIKNEIEFYISKGERIRQTQKV